MRQHVIHLIGVKARFFIPFRLNNYFKLIIDDPIIHINGTSKGVNVPNVLRVISVVDKAHQDNVVK